MFENSYFDSMRQMFLDQFEADSQDFIYRKSMTGAPIRITLAERDAFLATFNRRLRYATWSMVLATPLLVGLVAFAPDLDGDPSEAMIYGGLGLLLAAFMGVYWWAWTAPARELERRPALGAPRSRDEVRTVMLAKITYGRLGLSLLAIAVLLFQVGSEHDLLSGWNRLWLVGAGFCALGVAFQAYRKWRFDSSGS